MSTMRFRMVPELSDSMNCALTWLIQRGGIAHWQDLIQGAKALGHRYAVTCTRATVAALVKRELITQGARHRVQVTDKAVGLICQHAGNPHPAPIMAAAVWGEAHSHAAYRREQGIDVPLAPPAPAGGYRIGTDRGECEALIRAQIQQVLARTGINAARFSRATVERLDAAVRRIADAWAADVTATADQAYENGANAFGDGDPYPLGGAIPSGTEDGA